MMKLCLLLGVMKDIRKRNTIIHNIYKFLNGKPKDMSKVF